MFHNIAQTSNQNKASIAESWYCHLVIELAQLVALYVGAFAILTHTIVICNLG